VSGRLDRSALPPERAFYEREVGPFKTRADRKGWIVGNCPFHKSKSGRSFSVKLENGAFYCFGCGVHGGDLVAFVRLRDKCSFKEACERLGCWSEEGSPAPRLPKTLAPFLVLEFTIAGRRYRLELPDSPKTEEQALRRYRADATERLHALHAGAPETFGGEWDSQWLILANAWELIEGECR
jgi:hypothetical protein